MTDQLPSLADTRLRFHDTSPEDDNPASQKPWDLIKKATKKVGMTGLLQPMKPLTDAESIQSRLGRKNDLNTH